MTQIFCTLNVHGENECVQNWESTLPCMNECTFVGEYYGENECTFMGEYLEEKECTFMGEYYGENECTLMGEYYGENECSRIIIMGLPTIA